MVRLAGLRRGTLASGHDGQRVRESSSRIFSAYVGSLDVEPESFRPMLQEIAIAEQVESWELQFLTMQPGREGDVRPYTCGFA
jgi:hypothetical protein